MPLYQIRGESGKTLGAGSYWLGADLKAVSGTLRYEAGGLDRLAWTARTADLAATETVLPDVGQMAELWWNAGFIEFRLFRGWVTKARRIKYGAAVEVEGAQQWLRKLSVTTSKTLNGSSDTRPTIEFPAGGMSTHLGTLMSRAISDGAKLQFAGLTGSSYSISKMRMSLGTYAQALGELLRMMPDALDYLDYQSSPTTDPILAIARQGSLGAITLTAGTDELVDYDVTPRPELVPSRVELKYIERGANQLPLYKVQASGTAVAGRTQVIVISGDEADSYLPQDHYESYVVQTANANLTLNNTKPYLLDMLPEVLASRSAQGGRPNATDVILANGESVQYSSGIGTGSTIRSEVQPPLQFADATTGASVSRVGKHFVLGDEPPEWAANTLASPQAIKILGRIYVLQQIRLHNSSNTAQQEVTAPNWVTAFPWTFTKRLPGYVSTGNSSWPWATVDLLALDFELETLITTTNQSVPRTVYRPQDFEYNSPPSGLAANLLAAQNFTPCEGFAELQYTSPQAGGITPANRINIAGAEAWMASMNATAKAVTYDLISYKIRIDLGAPARFDTTSVAGKVRASQQANITMNAP